MKKSNLLPGLLSILCVLLSACTGGGGGQQASITVKISPPSVTVLLGAPQPFTVTITGTSNIAVSWTVKEGAAGGSIDGQGNYTAPQVAGTYHVVVTSLADPSKSATATVTVPLAVSVSPNPATVFLGAMQPFTATILGSTNTTVTWTVQEGAAGGTIDAQGNYTAPKVVGTYHVIATSVADKTQSAAATVTVPPVTVTVSPDSPTVFLGAMQAFTATVTATNTAVTWTVQEGAVGGTIDAQGNYTAPKVAGTYHVTATSVADKTQSATATVTVPPVAVSISPTTDTLGPNGLRSFGTLVTGASDTSVTWSITEGAGGGTVVNGAYTAPAIQGTFHVVATSVADPTKSATAIVTVVASGFLPTGNMTTARASHTATLLNTGEALITGGISHYRFVQSGINSICFPIDSSTAELFNPATGTFAVTSPMTALRASHTATLLQDGKVLVAGGTSAASAEIYNPTTAAFTATGNMLSQRQKHTATLLPSGKVLLAGGLIGGLSAELFDPALGAFASTGSMADVRSSHTATLLPNGKVLVAGGVASNGTVSTAELYDPAAGAFTATGSMTSPRVGHTATLIPSTGMVLIAGGFDQNSTALTSAELYNSVTGAFTATGSMAGPHTQHTATLLPSGKVLIAGGRNFVAELFDPVTGTFTLTGSMVLSRANYAATALPGGDVLVTGSQTPVRKLSSTCVGGATASAEIYH